MARDAGCRIGTIRQGGPSQPLGWAWQDFPTLTSTDITITANENGSNITFVPAKVVSDTAVIVRAEYPDSFAYTGAIPLISTKVKVTSHTGVDVDINSVPSASYKPFRVYYLYNYDSLPNDYTLAPAFIRDTNIVEIDNLFVSEEEFAAMFPLNHDNPAHVTNTGVFTHIQIDSHITNQNNPHNVTAEQVGSPSEFDKTDSFDVTVDNQTEFVLEASPSEPADTAKMYVNGVAQTYGEHYTITNDVLTFYPLVAGFILETNNEFGQPDKVLVRYML